jgi:nucleoside-diphosphate kinase
VGVVVVVVWWLLRLREVTGPHDPDIARVIRPNSVRAQHGIDKVQNALHVTDLPDDGQLETEYFFSMLARAS